jgi:hypothetical protein
MDGYLPQIQYASECAWTHRRTVEDPARSRVATLRSEVRLSRPARLRNRRLAVGLWVRWIRGAGSRSVSPSQV